MGLVLLLQNNAIEAPGPTASEEYVEEDEAKQHRCVPTVHRREEGAREMRYEIYHRHVTGENKGHHARISAEEEGDAPAISITPWT